MNRVQAEFTGRRWAAQVSATFGVKRLFHIETVDFSEGEMAATGGGSAL